MARTPVIRELNGAGIANAYGGWLYCGHCGGSVGYLCYVTYDNLRLDFECECGGTGSVRIAFGDVKNPRSGGKLVPVKNRQCCPDDGSPLITILDKKLKSYCCEIDCAACGAKYTLKKRQ